MVSSISSSRYPVLAVPTKLPADKFQAKAVQAADSAMALILKNDQVLQALVSRSSRWVPPTFSRVMATVWGALDVSGARTLTKKDVEKSVREAGGTTSMGDDLWKQIDPKGAGYLSSGDFITNTYIGGVVTSNLADEQKAVDDTRLQLITAPVQPRSMLNYLGNGRATGTLFDYAF